MKIEATSPSTIFCGVNIFKDIAGYENIIQKIKNKLDEKK